MVRALDIANAEGEEAEGFAENLTLRCFPLDHATVKMRARAWTLVSILIGAVAVLAPEPDAEAKGGACPGEMGYVEGNGVRVCVDRWEASLIDVASGRVHPPYGPLNGRKVRAQSKPNTVPQAYISKVEAEAACKAAGKRLCKEAEWMRACQGKVPTAFPYGDDERSGYCNDHGTAPIGVLFKDTDAAFHSSEAMNDPRLNQVPGTLARTGSFKKCRNAFGLYDMVGNLHEWIDDPSGTFRGGYYLDTHKNGLGCKYRTTAHHPRYHDYSTGFRCCKDPR